MKIIYFGTPEFAAIVLKKLVKGNFKPVLVVTSPDKPVGRNQILTFPPVKTLAEKYGLPVLQPEAIKNPELLKVLLNSQPDLIVLAAFGEILPKEILDLPQYGCLNVHPSLLPKYRGASPIPHQILAGEKESGVSIIRMSEKIDQGDILAQEKMEISPQETTATLTPKLADLGGQLLLKTIPLLVQGKIAPRPQGATNTPYCYQLKKEDGKIDWSRPADLISRQVRAFDPWPGAFTRQAGKALKILKASVINEFDPQKSAGFVFLAKDKKLAVQTGQLSLTIEIVQPEGKKPMIGQDFMRGHQEIIGQILC